MTNSDMITLLKSFLEIVKYMNVTRAAENFGITQSAMSNRMNKLSKEIGSGSFFYTEHHQLHLTEDGMILKEKAERIVAAYDEILGDFALRK